MPLIEGIGDEVTVLVTCLVVLAVAVIAWTSTHVNVRTHTSVVIIDRERFGELIRRVRGIAVRSSFADNIDASNLSANAAEAHTTTDSLLVSGAAANDVDNLTPDYSHGEGVDSEETCLPERETSSLPQKADDMLQSESESSVTSNKNCSETALPHRVATATAVTADNENILQHNTDGSGDTSGDSIQVRLQFVDGRQRTVVASPDDTIGHFKRSHFASELASNLVVRFIAGGQELKDDASTLRSHRIAVSGAVLHCLVTPARAAASATDDRQNVGYHFDVGILMFPLFGTLLAALWYARVVYRGYFNGTSTFSLLAVSFLYIIALLASLRGGAQTEHHPHVE